MDNTREIWEAYHSNLYSFIRHRVTNKEITEDILQDIFVNVHKKINTLKDNTKLESWLYQIARNSIVDYYRAKKPDQELPDWIAQPEIEYEEQIRKDLSGCLASMVSQLPTKYRQAVYMSEIEGKPQKLVAEKEGISLSGAKSRVQRGRDLLKTIFSDCCEIEINAKNQLVDYEKKSDCRRC